MDYDKDGNVMRIEILDASKRSESPFRIRVRNGSLILTKIQIVPGLPKTRSGKIMRRILRKNRPGRYR